MGYHQAAGLRGVKAVAAKSAAWIESLKGVRKFVMRALMARVRWKT